MGENEKDFNDILEDRQRKREVLVHLNVSLPVGDPRVAFEIRDAVLGALEVGSDHETMRGLTIVCPLAEEV